jgi:hypothetical protein
VAVQDRLSLRNVYLYLVCLVTLVISLFAAVNLVRSAVALAYPDPGWYGYEVPHGEESEISEEERARQEQRARESQRRHDVLEVVGSATTLLIAGPVYVYHWRRVQTELAARAREEPVPS